jgi:hypothetical protein
MSHFSSPSEPSLLVRDARGRYLPAFCPFWRSRQALPQTTSTRNLTPFFFT